MDGYIAYPLQDLCTEAWFCHSPRAVFINLPGTMDPQLIFPSQLLNVVVVWEGWLDSALRFQNTTLSNNHAVFGEKSHQFRKLVFHFFMLCLNSVFEEVNDPTISHQDPNIA